MSGGARARIDVVEAPGDGLVVELAGELDLAGLPAVNGAVAELLTRPAQPVVLDLGGRCRLTARWSGGRRRGRYLGRKGWADLAHLEPAFPEGARTCRTGAGR